MSVGMAFKFFNNELLLSNLLWNTSDYHIFRTLKNLQNFQLLRNYIHGLSEDSAMLIESHYI